MAQSNSWSLEELTLKMTVLESSGTKPALDECSFGATGLKLQGAICKNNKISLSPNIVNNLNVTVLKWSRDVGGESSASAAASSEAKINLPVYLNSTRSELLFTIKMDTDQSDSLFFMRGVAILASNLGS